MAARILTEMQKTRPETTRGSGISRLQNWRSDPGCERKPEHPITCSRSEN